MSSAMASVNSRIFSPFGTRGPSSVSTPTTKAMSVAIGTPQPRQPGRPHNTSE